MPMIESITQCLADNLETDEYRIGGAASESQIASAEMQLSLRFPDDYRRFLAEVGWLEVFNMYFFGVPEDVENGEGSVVGMTRYARAQWNLPPEFLVFYSSEDVVLWCMKGIGIVREIEVVAFDVEKQKVIGRVGSSFWEVITGYLQG